MRFRPEQHLRRQDDFRAVRTQGRRVDCGSFTLFWLGRSQGSEVRGQGSEVSSQGSGVGSQEKLIRAGFVASTAAVGGAILRNRAKRRMREVFRRHQGLVPAGCDVLLVARRPAALSEFGDLESRFTQACRKISPRPNA